jgi:hypothetical protein
MAELLIWPQVLHALERAASRAPVDFRQRAYLDHPGEGAWRLTAGDGVQMLELLISGAAPTDQTGWISTQGHHRRPSLAAQNTRVPVPFSPSAPPPGAWPPGSLQGLIGEPVPPDALQFDGQRLALLTQAVAALGCRPRLSLSQRALLLEAEVDLIDTWALAALAPLAPLAEGSNG